MPVPSLRYLVLTTLLAAANLSAARADRIPAPTEPLRDYDGKGIVQIDIPGKARDKDSVEPGQKLWFPFQQSWVRPNRFFLDIEIYGARQRTLVQGNIERTYSPRSVIIERVYKNMETAAENPMASARLSMVAYASALRELDCARLLPPEDLDAVKAAETARIAELTKLRAKLEESKDAGEVEKAETLALEQARLKDDLSLIEFRRSHPCHVVEFNNKDMMNVLLTRGLIGEGAADVLAGGKTRVWLTRLEGLPIRIETTANDGRVAVSFCFKQLDINVGIPPGSLVLGAPLGTDMISAVADVKEKDWEQKLVKTLEREMELYYKDHPQSGGRTQATLKRPGKK